MVVGLSSSPHAFMTLTACAAATTTLVMVACACLGLVTTPVTATNVLDGVLDDAAVVAAAVTAPRIDVVAAVADAVVVVDPTKLLEPIAVEVTVPHPPTDADTATVFVIDEVSVATAITTPTGDVTTTESAASASTAAVAAAAVAAAASDVYLPVYDAPDAAQHPPLTRQGDMSPKLARFVAEQRAWALAGDPRALSTPYLVVDTDVVRASYTSLRDQLPPNADVFYAVKANPAPEVLRALSALGSNFDAASKGEIDLCLSLDVSPDRISFGNTIKAERSIAYAHSRGINLYAFDSHAELLKLARSAPGSRVFARVLMLCEGAEWPLSRKFGCSLDMATQLLVEARALGLVPYGMSFHVGSQQTRLASWDDALAHVGAAYRTLQTAHNITLGLLNLGGGFPARYQRDVPSVERYADAVRTAVARHFGDFNANPNRTATTTGDADTPVPFVPVRLILEPGRSVVGDSGVIDTEVLLISNKSLSTASGTSADGERTWVYLDAGRFGGLPETQDEAIKYRFQVPFHTSRTDLMHVTLAGPSCDSADILYERAPYLLPRDLRVGDRLAILATGAYTLTYSAIGFNGFAPLYCVCI